MHETTEDFEMENEKGFIARVASEASDRFLNVVDPDVVLDHVDVNALLDRVDINALLDRVDVERLMDRIDIDALMERVDVKELVDRAGIPEIVIESTGHLGGSALDFFRKPLVGLDEIVFRTANRLVRRDPDEFQKGPGDLSTEDDHPDGTATKTGRYAGPVTRVLALTLDLLTITVSFTFLLGAVTFFINLLSQTEFSLQRSAGWISIASIVVLGFAYYWFSFAVVGKTLGMKIVGLRVVKDDGSLALGGSQAFLRTFFLPFNIILPFLSAGVVFGEYRRALHDFPASSAVVYDWGGREASLPSPLANWLERRGADV